MNVVAVALMWQLFMLMMYQIKGGHPEGLFLGDYYDDSKDKKMNKKGYL
ncbi:hypothetical protein [Lysinibacillus xylanilyticus]